MSKQSLIDVNLEPLLASCDTGKLLKTLTLVARLFARSHNLLSQLSTLEQTFLQEWAAEGANPVSLAWRGENVASEIAAFLKEIGFETAEAEEEIQA